MNQWPKGIGPLFSLYTIGRAKCKKKYFCPFSDQSQNNNSVFPLFSLTSLFSTWSCGSERRCCHSGLWVAHFNHIGLFLLARTCHWDTDGFLFSVQIHNVINQVVMLPVQKTSFFPKLKMKLISLKIHIYSYVWDIISTKPKFFFFSWI